MVAREQALEFLNKLRTNKPTTLFNKIDETAVGMKFLLAYLSENNGEVYASTVAEKMNISRARVAVLIQKLMNKGLISKTISKTDRRIEVLNITDAGLKEANKFIEQILSALTIVIEKIGLDELYKFVETSAKIKNILKEIE